MLLEHIIGNLTFFILYKWECTSKTIHKIGVNNNTHHCSHENKTKEMVATPILKWNSA